MFTEKLGQLRKIGPVLDYCLVGHMGEGKNVELVIEAFIELYKRGSKAQITFYGGSEERLAELQNQYDLPPTIHFKGIVNEVTYHLHNAICLQVTQSYLPMPVLKP